MVKELDRGCKRLSVVELADVLDHSSPEVSLLGNLLCTVKQSSTYEDALAKAEKKNGGPYAARKSELKSSGPFAGTKEIKPVRASRTGCGRPLKKRASRKL